MEWTPGRLLYLADTLSRLVGSVEVKGEISEEMEAQVLGVYEGLPASNQQLQKIVEETAKDEVLLAVLRCIMEGWKAGECMTYAHYKD